MDPGDERAPVRRPLAPRAPSLSGPVGILDISKPRGDVFIDELEKLFQKNLPDIEVRRYRKPTFAKPCPDALRAKIRAECRVLVEALAD
jgi:hypothetical protein